MAFNDTNITMVKGDTLSFGIEYDGTEQDLDSAIFAVKPTDDSAEFLFEKWLGNGIEKAATGVYIVRVAPEDTRYKQPGTYLYDFQVGINDDVFTLMHGALTIEADVARVTG